MSRIAFTGALPRVRRRLLDQVAVCVRRGVGRTDEQCGDVAPSLPSTGRRWNQTSSEATGYRDLDLLAALNASHKIRSVVAKFSQPN